MDDSNRGKVGKLKNEEDNVWNEDEDVELNVLKHLRTALSSILLMLENARDDIKLHAERCDQLSDVSKRCRDVLSLSTSSGDDGVLGSPEGEQDDSLDDRTESKNKKGSTLDLERKISSKYLGSKSKP